MAIFNLHHYASSLYSRQKPDIGLVELRLLHKQPFENILQSEDSLWKEVPKMAGFHIEEPLNRIINNAYQR